MLVLVQEKKKINNNNNTHVAAGKANCGSTQCQSNLLKSSPYDQPVGSAGFSPQAGIINVNLNFSISLARQQSGFLVCNDSYKRTAHLTLP